MIRKGLEVKKTLSFITSVIKTTTYLIEPANALRLSIVFEDFSLIVILSTSKLLQSLTSA
jgi:hypothetical protein